MSPAALNINEAARELRVSTRTIRRFIKAGKIKAELVNGTFGPEYRIPEIPADLRKAPPEPEDEQIDLIPESAPSLIPAATGVNVGPANQDRILVMIQDLQERNMVLAAQLGTATERIRNLEIQLKQLNTPAPPSITTGHNLTKSWWQRLFGPR